MTEKFKQKLKENGQNLRWFYNVHIVTDNVIDLTYSGFTAQLNGYAPVSEDVQKHLNKYLKNDRMD